MAKRQEKHKECKYCEDGIIWLTVDSDNSQMYRCPFCNQADSFLIDEIPYLSKEQAIENYDLDEKQKD